MRRGTIVLVLFVLIAAGIIGASYLLQSQPILTLTVAVDPLIEDWAREAISAFNASNPVVGAGRRVQFASVEVIDDERVWNGSANWTSATHPDVWIASSSFSVEWARSRYGALQTVETSLAQTPLIWGGYTSRVNVLTEGTSNPLTWQAVLASAESGGNWEALGGQTNWGFLRTAFALPDQTMSGMAVLLSASANYADSASLTGAQLTDSGFRTWLTPVFETVNFTTIGNDVAAYVARGTASADVAIAPESQWLENLAGITRNEPVKFSYPQYTFLFDFPLAYWDDATTLEDERAAINRLGDWLLTAEQQAKLPQRGLRPVSLMIESDNALFAQGEPYGIQLNPTFSNLIQLPALPDAQRLIQWFQSVSG